jgi:hypothetical protein
MTMEQEIVNASTLTPVDTHETSHWVLVKEIRGLNEAPKIGLVLEGTEAVDVLHGKLQTDPLTSSATGKATDIQTPAA